MPSKRIAVIGGGITGLSVCYYLERQGAEEICLFEGDGRLGGKLQTSHENGYTVELAPDSIFTRHPEVLEFIDEIGLRHEVIEPASRGFSIWIDGGLRAIPGGLTRLGGVDGDDLARFPYLTEESKRQVLNESRVAPNLEEDESVRDFFSRRFGPEYAAKIAEPLFAGTHGGSAQLLSMQSLFPSYRELERKYGSLTQAGAAGAMASLAKFISFREGTEALPRGVAARLQRTRTLRQKVNAVVMDGLGVDVSGQRFDAVVVATPPRAAASLLRRISPEASRLIGEIKAASSTVVTLGYDARLEGLFGTGFLVPEQSGEAVTGGTWTSQKWNERCPLDQTLLRVFLKGTPETALDSAKSGLAKMAGIRIDPHFSRVVRWPEGLPQYRVGHEGFIREIERLLAQVGPIFLAGQSFRGVGIPDCVRQGRQAALYAINA